MLDAPSVEEFQEIGLMSLLVSPIASPPAPEEETAPEEEGGSLRDILGDMPADAAKPAAPLDFLGAARASQMPEPAVSHLASFIGHRSSVIRCSHLAHHRPPRRTIPCSSRRTKNFCL
jgi:hypothetical protein